LTRWWNHVSTRRSAGGEAQLRWIMGFRPGHFQARDPCSCATAPVCHGGRRQASVGGQLSAIVELPIHRRPLLRRQRLPFSPPSASIECRQELHLQRPHSRSRLKSNHEIQRTPQIDITGKSRCEARVSARSCSRLGKSVRPEAYSCSVPSRRYVRRQACNRQDGSRSFWVNVSHLEILPSTNSATL